MTEQQAALLRKTRDSLRAARFLASEGLDELFERFHQQREVDFKARS